MQTLYDIVPVWSDTNILQSDNDVRVSHRVFEDVSVLSELEQDVGSRGWREAKTHRHTLNVHRVHLNWSVMKCEHKYPNTVTQVWSSWSSDDKDSPWV